MPNENEIFIPNTKTMINFIDSSLHCDSKFFCSQDTFHSSDITIYYLFHEIFIRFSNTTNFVKPYTVIRNSSVPIRLIRHRFVTS